MGSFEANSYGLYDMAGNVWKSSVEWRSESIVPYDQIGYEWLADKLLWILLTCPVSVIHYLS